MQMSVSPTYIYIYVPHSCMCIQKSEEGIRYPGTGGTELHMVVNCHIGGGKQTQLLCKSNKCS